MEKQDTKIAEMDGDSKSDPKQDRKKEKRYWLDDMKNVNKLFWALVVVCGLLLLLDLFYEKHVHFEFEHWFGFFGFYGFLLSMVLVLTAKQLRKILMRDEDFYER